MLNPVRLRALPAVAALFLQACGQQPEIIVDQTKETHAAAAQKAEVLNRSAAKVFARMKDSSIDGKGRVFFQDGLGIVYPQGLVLARSEVVKEGTCVEQHPEPLWGEAKCATRIVESFASMPRIHSPDSPLYINARKAVVCPDKQSAVQSLNAEFDLARDKSPCKDVSPEAFPSNALYQHVMRGIRASRGIQIEKSPFEWANIMPTSI